MTGSTPAKANLRFWHSKTFLLFFTAVVGLLGISSVAVYRQDHLSSVLESLEHKITAMDKERNARELDCRRELESLKGTVAALDEERNALRIQVSRATDIAKRLAYKVKSHRTKFAEASKNWTKAKHDLIIYFEFFPFY